MPKLPVPLTEKIFHALSSVLKVSAEIINQKGFTHKERMLTVCLHIFVNL